jgi:hypothetical protein
VPPAQATEWVLEQFASTRVTARRRYAEFVHDGIGVPGPWEKVKGQVLLGSEAFILETAVETHIQAQGTESKDFSTAPQFTKTVNSSMASNG